MSRPAPASGSGDGAPVRRTLEFDRAAVAAPRARVGLVALASDQTIEADLHRILGPIGVGLYATRITNANTITPETLRAMADGIGPAAGVILPGVDLDVVAYGCTSASVEIGEDAVAAAVRAARPGVRVTTPITAALAAFRALGVRRVALLTPYVAAVDGAIRAHLEANGVRVAAMGSFEENDDRRVAGIAPAAIESAVLELADGAAVDGVFVSCTALRALDALPALEARLDLPVVASNPALAWHALRLAGIEDRLPAFGRLFA